MRGGEDDFLVSLRICDLEGVFTFQDDSGWRGCGGL